MRHGMRRPKRDTALPRDGKSEPQVSQPRRVETADWAVSGSDLRRSGQWGGSRDWEALRLGESNLFTGRALDISENALFP
ncbi:hypothetical protein PICMEDRAFT_124633 [Pichia membranifaciens NRRL Y-2026]|uniref:Uncharacterized protein n=1 Tax=Pichia membranifaciens NRRL Y-2026 TaxID=763406 RepID=A0A1E3NQ06_9ASCO|nr:hypothetical protein PICMEDRAFT_124633 [Pichia membranifaciens NRRL Y-2026]ODQ48189.1 hypothetical protein PICMEDRAFT_124633 [Pichia membranifaciens NRRL Y-2026]